MDDPTRQYERLLLQSIAAINNRIRKVYEQAITEISFKAATVNYKGTLFKLSDYPLLQKQVDALIKKMQPSIYNTIVNSIKGSWGLSNKKNDLIVDRRLAGRTPKPKVKQILYDPNIEALNEFIARKEQGMNLSARVWQAVTTLRKELEQALGLSISKGESATTTATQLKKYLNSPNQLFRRVRNDEGKLVLSKRAREFHPGQGVYRSSYQNALRLAGSEVNIAYSMADHVRWQGLPFVIGIEVHTSNNHPTPDICDELAGKYPKDFVYKKWHPRCRCYATIILLNDAEYNRVEDAILNGEKIPESEATITKPHAGFTNFMRKNAKTIAGWKSKPYFILDNKKYIHS